MSINSAYNTKRQAVSLFVLLSVLFPASITYAEQNTFAEKTLASYEPIQSVSTLVRKTTEVRGKSFTLLSRVYYQRPNRLHVENIAPVKRRILSDGSRFYIFQDGWEKGYSTPLADLEGEWKIMQQTIPATPMEHLLRLRGIPEIILPDADQIPIRRGYNAENIFVVLSGDEQNRLVLIEFFKDSSMSERSAFYQLDNFVHITNNCWIARRHKAELTIDGELLRETRRFDNLQINKAIAIGMFEAQAFFENVDFTNDLSELRKE